LLINAVQGQSGSSTQPVVFDRNGQEGLVSALSGVPDPRDARGVRHGLPTVLGLALAAVLAGSRSVYAIGQWIAGCSQKTLKAFDARVDPASGRYVSFANEVCPCAIEPCPPRTERVMALPRVPGARRC
jgi:hypothetical protein